MAAGQKFDMKEYIEKRMMELENPEERRLFKKVAGELLVDLYEYNRKAYEDLEKRILDEYRPGGNQYAIYISIIERSRCDITDPFLQPMRPGDMKKDPVSCQDICRALSENRPMEVDGVFFKGSASWLYKLLSQKERLFHGIIRTTRGECRADFSLKRNETYLQMVEELYPVFEFNGRAWLTVCTAYLTKLLDVSICRAEGMEEEGEILGIEVDFEEYQELILHDMIPLWNLAELTEKTSAYPAPCIDRIHYEHRIFAQRLQAGCEYLIRNRDTEVTGIRRLNGDLYITCPEERPCVWHLYQAAVPNGRERYPYPVLSNRYKESFSGSIRSMFQGSVKTRTELGRIMESFDYGNYVTFQGIRIESSIPPECVPCNYNMDGFMPDEFRRSGCRQVLVLEFVQAGAESFLTEDIMSFLVTQAQRSFPEYHCVGRLAGVPK